MPYSTSPKETANFYIPFDFYDFFGYLFPGFTAILYLLAFYWFVYPGGLLWIISLVPTNYIHVSFYYISVIIVTYILGHAIATTSAIILDRMIVSGIFGYPHVNLFAISQGKRIYHEATYKYIFFLLNLGVLIPLVIYNIQIARSIIAMIATLIGLLAVFRILLEVLRPFIKKETIARISDKGAFRLYLMPDKYIFTPIIGALRAITHTDMAFPRDFVSRYETIFKNQFRLEMRQANTEVYWLSYLRVTAGNPYHSALIKTWLHLYAFARNMSCVSYLAASALALWIFTNSDNSSEVKLILLAAVVSAWVFFVRYWMLYYIYYSKSIYRIFYSIADSVDFKANVPKDAKY
jgi:hypothetical protein